jgi:hypothetical protein
MISIGSRAIASDLASLPPIEAEGFAAQTPRSCAATGWIIDGSVGTAIARWSRAALQEPAIVGEARKRGDIAGDNIAFGRQHSG